MNRVLSFPLLFILLCSTALAQSDTARPSVSWQVNNSNWARQARGLRIDTVRTDQRYPTLPVLFFECGSADLPERYCLLGPDSVARFSQKRIHGSTMEKYRQLLDVVGVRMLRYPNAHLTVTGYSSNEPSSGENDSVAIQRAVGVRDYLTRAYGVASSRIDLRAHLLPTNPSRGDDAMGREENRRVELQSDDPRLFDIVWEYELVCFRSTDSLILHVASGGFDSAAVERRVEIRRGDHLWQSISLAPGGDTTVVTNWGYMQNRDSTTLDADPYEVQVVVAMRDGRQVSSDVAEVPVEVRPEEVRYCPPGWTINEYNLLFFPYDDATATAFHRMVIENEMTPLPKGESTVSITGHTDVIGRRRYNHKLSTRRAKVVEMLMGSLMPRETAVYSAGVGEDNPLYTNELPEGRFLNRAVNVRCVGPCP